MIHDTYARDGDAAGRLALAVIRALALAIGMASLSSQVAAQDDAGPGSSTQEEEGSPAEEASAAAASEADETQDSGWSGDTSVIDALFAGGETAEVDTAETTETADTAAADAESGVPDTVPPPAEPEPYDVIEVDQLKPAPLPEKLGDQESATLSDIVVTATKREKSLRDIPASISAFDGEDLEARGILSINEVLETSPGVTTNSARPGDQRIVMRGISTSSNPTSTVPYPVGIFIGDTALNEPYAANITPDLSAFDLAAVEVLKGPQGTLFGGAALAGVLRYRLNDPEPYRWQARYFGQTLSPAGGSFGWAQGLVLNAPLFGEENDLGLRVGYIRRRYPGVIDDARPEQAQEDVNEGDGDQIRAGLLWDPGNGLQLKFTYLDQDYAADNDLVIADSLEGNRQTRGSLLPWVNRHQFALYNLEAQYDWDTMRFVSSTSRTEKERFNIIDSSGAILGVPPDGTPDALAIPFLTDQSSTSFQQELRLQSLGGERFEWLAGAYYLRSPIRYFLTLNVQALNTLGTNLGDLQGAVLGITDTFGLRDLTEQLLTTLVPASADFECELTVLCAQTDARAEEKALFFDLTWKPWEPLELSFGGRLYETTVAGGFTGQGVGARAVNNGMSPADFTTTITERGFNPKFSAVYQFTDRHSVYALANKGFRFGGIQNIPASEAENIPATYKSDFIWNYEVGLRTRWFDNTLEFDITAFHIDYEDPLVVLKNAIQINYYDNVGAAESDGFEASLRWLTPIPGVVLTAAGGTVDARTTVDFQAGRQTVPAGKPLPGSAEYQYSASLAVFGPPGWFVNLAGTAGYSYVGKTFNDITSDRLINDYGTVNVGLNLSLPTVNGRPTLALNVSNLLDETAAVSVVPITGNRGEFFILNAPRLFTARLSLEFE